MNAKDIFKYSIIAGAGIASLAILVTLLKSVKGEKPTSTLTATSPEPSPTTTTSVPSQQLTYKIKTINHTFDLNPFGIPKKFTIKNIKIVEITQDGQTSTAFYNSLPIYGRLPSLNIVGRSISGGSYATKTFPDGLYVILSLISGRNVVKKISAKVDVNGVFYFENAIDISDIDKIRLDIGEGIKDVDGKIKVIKSPLLSFQVEQSTTDITAYKLPTITNTNINDIINSQSFRHAAGLYYSSIVENTSPYSLEMGLKSATLTTYIFDNLFTTPTEGYIDVNGNDIKAATIKIEANNSSGTVSLNDIAEKYYRIFKDNGIKKALEIAVGLLTHVAYKINGSGYVGYIWHVKIKPGYTIFPVRTPAPSFEHVTYPSRETFDVIVYDMPKNIDISEVGDKCYESVYALVKKFHGVFGLIPAGYKGNYTGHTMLALSITPGYNLNIVKNNLPKWYSEILEKYTSHSSTNNSNVNLFNIPPDSINVSSTMSNSPYCPVYSGNGSLYVTGYLSDEIYGSSTVFSTNCGFGGLDWCTILKAIESFTYKDIGPVIPLFKKKSNSPPCDCKVFDCTNKIKSILPYKDTPFIDLTPHMYDQHKRDWYHEYLRTI